MQTDLYRSVHTSGADHHCVVQNFSKASPTNVTWQTEKGKKTCQRESYCWPIFLCGLLHVGSN